MICDSIDDNLDINVRYTVSLDLIMRLNFKINVRSR